MIACRGEELAISGVSPTKVRKVQYLSNEGAIVHFINADLIAAGLSPLAPSRAALRAGRLVLAEIDRLAKDRESFAFESTLSGRGYAERLKRLRRRGYRIEIVFLRVASPQLALRRIAARVRQGGHSVPKEDVLRRFDRGWRNFINIYQSLATTGWCTKIRAK
jgi:predicted ABC-type ATPase